MTEQMIGRYVLGPETARDTISVTYEARDSLLGRRVAVRLLAPSHGADTCQESAAAARFSAESRAQASLSHPGTPAVLDAGEWDGRPFVVLEAPEGSPVGDALELGGPLPVHSALDVIRQVLAVLAHAHERHVYHGALSVNDVLVTSTGRATVRAIRLPGPSDPSECSRLEADDLRAAAKLLWAMLVGTSAPTPGETGASEKRGGIAPRLVRIVASALHEEQTAGPSDLSVTTCQGMLEALGDPLLLSPRTPATLTAQAREDLSGRLSRAALAVGAGLALVSVLCQIWEFGVLSAVASASAVAAGERARGAVVAGAAIVGGLVTFLAH